MKLTTQYCFDDVLIAALWSSADTSNDECEYLDKNYFLSDIDNSAREKIELCYLSFLHDAMPLLEKSGLSKEQIAHDYWLTSQSHGTGFWDRGLGTLGHALSGIAKNHKAGDLVVGDDGKIYCE